MKAKHTHSKIHDYLKNGKDLWRLLNCLRSNKSHLPPAMLDTNGTLVSDHSRVRDIWTEHFANLASEKEDSPLDFDQSFKQVIELEYTRIRAHPGSNPELDRDITPEEVAQAIASLKKGTAPGPDGLLSDFFKAGLRYRPPASVPHQYDEPNPFCTAVTALFQSIFASGRWPEAWRKGIVVPLFKKGNPTDPSNYRGITLLPVFSKIMMSIVNDRLQSYLESHGRISEFQAGFRHSRSCQEQIFNLSSIVEGRKHQGQATFLVFMDLRKACDYVWRKGMLVKLARMGIKGRIWSLLDASFVRFDRWVRISSSSSPSDLQPKKKHTFSLPRGLPQGAVESPLCFSIFVEDLVPELRRRDLGVPTPFGKVAILLFADDMVLLASSAAETRILLQVVDAYLRRWRLKLNPSPKTMWMCVGARPCDRSQ
ncbi:MAG: reverse transcriptase family protein, partial [Bacteroidota bacterium]